eukprot:CAMPEP_0197429210 /NCGR_PEP_ID=MMETSP1170-20131217/43267_1 /TAXON_ID=54406 /ORGANISM="Sarcinochrysis sp, Strain CCMP770" /LENGTH=56 /DNA_ID=CAMNT_0042957033 /DNA_START=85 /DNA_END=251 /DNA_ORIENTATION=+
MQMRRVGAAAPSPKKTDIRQKWRRGRTGEKMERRSIVGRMSTGNAWNEEKGRSSAG